MSSGDNKPAKIASSVPASQVITVRELKQMAHDERTAAALKAATTSHERRKAKEAYFARKAAEKKRMAEALAKDQAEIDVSEHKGSAAPKDTRRYRLTDSQMQRLKLLIAERIERRREALKLWKPMPVQEAFQDCTAKERVVYGSNRSGKTTVSAVEVARIVTGQHPKLSGTKLPVRDGIACLVGYDYSHIGRVLFRKLFRKGAFKIIKDLETGKWRPYEPDGIDSDRPRKDAQPAPPLIPKRFIAPGGISWYRKKENIPKSIKLATGWELRFYSSEGEPPQGDAVHLFWLDEEMINEAWYTEAARGLADESGFFIWSATPHVGGDALIDLHARSEKCKHDPNGVTREFLLLIFNNQHLAKKDKDELIEKFKDNPEAYRTRILGEFAAKAFKVYSEFSLEVHGFDFGDLPGGRIPDDWCRYVAIDPGHQVTAVLFLAVPPLGKYTYRWYIYDEMYLEKSSATKFAEAFEVKTRGQSFEAWIIDMRAGRTTPTGGEKPVYMTYADALRAVRVRRQIPQSTRLPEHVQHRLAREARESDKFEITNCWERVKHQVFIPGADNPKAGITAVKEALTVQAHTGLSMLAFARGKLPNLEYEFDHYHHKRVKGKLTDEVAKKDDHLMDSLRYLVCARPEWQRPKKIVRPVTAALKRLRDKQARLDSQRSNSVNLGPRSSRLLTTG